MIVAEQKTLDEVKTLIGEAEKVLVVGCGTCVTVCFAGGAREAKISQRAEGVEGVPGIIVPFEGVAGPGNGRFHSGRVWLRPRYGPHRQWACTSSS